VEDRDKRQLLMKKLESCDGLTLIFVETKRNADYIEDWLREEGILATSIHGDRSQPEREQALRDFRSGRYVLGHAFAGFVNRDRIVNTSSSFLI
jgi:ATP-dependent RNA helicase DDX3X